MFFLIGFIVITAVSALTYYLIEISPVNRRATGKRRLPRDVLKGVLLCWNYRVCHHRNYPDLPSGLIGRLRDRFLFGALPHPAKAGPKQT